MAFHEPRVTSKALRLSIATAADCCHIVCDYIVCDYVVCDYVECDYGQRNSRLIAKSFKLRSKYSLKNLPVEVHGRLRAASCSEAHSSKRNRRGSLFIEFRKDVMREALTFDQRSQPGKEIKFEVGRLLLSNT